MVKKSKDEFMSLKFAVPENHQGEAQTDVPPRICAPQRLGLPPAHTGPPLPTFAPSPFGTSTPSTMSASPSTGVFSAPQASSLFSSSTTFGASSPAGFGSSTPAFGESSSPAFGSSVSPFIGTSAFGSSTPIGATSTPAFEASSTQSFGFGSSSPSFGQSTSSLFGSTPSLVGTPTQGAQASTPTFGGQQGGSRVMPFTPTIETETNGTQPAWNLESIAAMSVYKDKTHEELRWEDYQRGDKGSSPFAATTSSNLFGSSPSFGATTSSLLFSSSSTHAFCSSPSLFGSSPTQGSTLSFGSGQCFSFNSFGATTSSQLFSSSSTPTVGSPPSLFGSSTPFGAPSTPAFGASSTPSSSLRSSSPTFGQSTSSFASGSTPSLVGSTPSLYGTPTQVAQASTPTFGVSRFGQSTFAPTTEREANGTTLPAEKLESIAAMPVYKDKAHEELRWENYQQGDKGEQLPWGRQCPGGAGFGLAISQSNAFAPVPAFGSYLTILMFPTPFGQSSISPLGSEPVFGQTNNMCNYPFALSPFGTFTPFGAQTESTMFASPSTHVFGAPQASSPVFGSSTPAFGASSSPVCGSSASPFGGTSAFGSSTLFGATSTPAFRPSSTPSFSFGSSTPAFGASSSPALGSSASPFPEPRKMEFGKRSVPSQNDVVARLAKHVMTTIAKGSNLVFSPTSINVLLGLVAAGANDVTKHQILSFLRSPSADHLCLGLAAMADQQERSASCLCVTNGVWIHKQVTLKSSFKELVENSYKATCRQADFASKPLEVIDEVNAWADKNTKGIIFQLLSKDLFTVETIRGSKLILANAIYFKGLWQQQFEKHLTKDRDFHLLDGKKVKVPFMSNHKNQYLGRYNGFQVMKLPYVEDHRRFSMYIYLPDAKDGLGALLERMVSESGFLDNHIPKWNIKVNDFKIPKFKIAYEFEVSKILKEMGLTSPFEGGLTEMVNENSSSSIDEEPRVSSILHKVFIEVDEKGTEAAAVTSMVSFGGCCRSDREYVSFVADHPFLFTIREDKSGVVLFMGQVLDPTN